MTIPQLSKKIKSSQNWKNPTQLKTSGSYIYKKPHLLSGYSTSQKYHRPNRYKKGKLRTLINTLIPIAVILILLGLIIIFGALAWVSRDIPSPDKVINRSITVSTKIYDRTEKTVLYDIHGDIKRSLIDFDQIPQYVINATLAAEDRNFYTHKGFSLTGIIRSVIKNIFTGSRVGGSTLTQQFVKNAVLSTEKTYTRKVKELLISYQLEKKFSKNEILQMYFNEIPYGSVIYGIEAASQSFFGKSVQDVTIAEGAILAAIPQAPTFYSPHGNNKDQLIVRQRYILDSMAELGFINQEQAEQAKNEKIIFKPLQESIIAPHFVMYVKELLSEQYGENFIIQEGLKVYTTLDLDKQKIAEEAVENGVATNGVKYNFTNASLVAIDPKTGQILSMVGSVDYFNNEIDGQVNVALRDRQPGSSFKPIVYTAAFIKGYTPDTILYDVVTDFDTSKTKPYIPHNYDLKENGPVTIRKALAGSLNIPAVKTTYLTGLDNILNLANNLGYSTLKDKDRFGLSIVLGGGEVKLLEHVGAYGVLAQNGVKHELNPILRIEDKEGKILYEYKDKKKEVLNPEISKLTTNILADDNARAYIFGAGSKLTLSGRPVAAKTGTTNNYRDAWTIGYTPSLVAGVWVGNNNNTEMKRGADGSVIAAPIWNEFMREALKDTTPESFPTPEIIKTGKPVLDGQESAEIKIKIDTISGKLATEFTPLSTIKELTIKEVHNILHYVNKDDPRGDNPNNPQTDPQYTAWEESVIRWAQEQGFDPNQGQDIPTNYDDIHLSQDQPNLIIITPLPNQTITDENLSVDVTASAKWGIHQIEYYINDQLITSRSDDNNTTINISKFSNGYHTLKVVAKDDLENTKIRTVELNFLLPQIVPTLNWTSPANNSTINLPITLNASLTNWQRITKIDFYSIKEGATLEQYINHTIPLEAQISLLWDKQLEAGNYTIFGNIFDIQGKKYQSEELKIVVK